MTTDTTLYNGDEALTTGRPCPSSGGAPASGDFLWHYWEAA